MTRITELPAAALDILAAMTLPSCGKDSGSTPVALPPPVITVFARRLVGGGGAQALGAQIIVNT
jgi:hypothetical protein